MPTAATPVGAGVHVPLPRDFDFAWALGFLAARTVPSLEAVGENDYRRSVRLRGKPVMLTISESPVARATARFRGQRELIVRSRPKLAPDTLFAAVKRMLDLDPDLDHCRRLARRDPILARIVGRRSGIRLPQLLDP